MENIMINIFCLKTYDFEWKILDFFDKFESEFLNLINQYLSEILGSLGIVVILFIIYWCISKDKGANIAYSLYTSMLFNNLIKGIISRRRPFEREGKEYLRKLDSSKDGATSSSFPSGHSMNSAAFYGGIVFNWRSRRFRPLRILSIIAIITVGLTRIYLGVHFPTDVIFGILLGLLIALVSSFLQEFFGNKKIILYLGTLVIFIPCLFFENFDRDFYKSIGMMIGFVPGIYLENKFIDFSNNVSILKKILRVFLGIAIVGTTYLIYSIVPSSIHNNNYFTLIMHTLISFFGVFLVPFVFTKYEKFLK